VEIRHRVQRGFKVTVSGSFRQRDTAAPPMTVPGGRHTGYRRGAFERNHKTPPRKLALWITANGFTGMKGSVINLAKRAETNAYCSEAFAFLWDILGWVTFS
jgi:hypothetical protein